MRSKLPPSARIMYAATQFFYGMNNIAHLDYIKEHTFYPLIGTLAWLTDKDKYKYLGMDNVFDCIGVILPAISPDNTKVLGLIHYNANTGRESSEALHMGINALKIMEEQGYTIGSPALLSRGCENSSIGHERLGQRARTSIKEIKDIFKKNGFPENLQTSGISRNVVISPNLELSKLPTWFMDITSLTPVENRKNNTEPPSKAYSLSADKKWVRYIKEQNSADNQITR